MSLSTELFRGKDLSIEAMRDQALGEIRSFLRGQPIQSPRDQVVVDVTNALIALGNFSLLDEKLKVARVDNQFVDLSTIEAHQDAYTEQNRVKGIIHEKSQADLSEDTDKYLAYDQALEAVAPKVRQLVGIETKVLRAMRGVDSESVSGLALLHAGSSLQIIRTENLTKHFTRKSI